MVGKVIELLQSRDWNKKKYPTIALAKGKHELKDIFKKRKK